MKTWETNNKDNAATHATSDGVVRYYTVAPEMTLDQVATEFLRGYDDGDTAGDVEFNVTDLRTDDSWSFAGRPNQDARRV